MPLMLNAFMRTTIDLPDPLFRRLKAAAALQGVSLKELVARAVRRELDAPPPPKSKRKVKFPLIRSRNPGSVTLTNDDIARILFG